MTPPDDRDAWVAKAWDRIDRARLRELVVGLVGVPSPTGDEAGVARWAVDALPGSVDARVQPLDDRQANAVARVRGAGGGPELLLYAPVDTLTTGTEADLPVVGDRLERYMRPDPEVRGDLVLGLGAGNPKGHAACVLAAVEAVAEAGVPLRGDLVAALGAGGMPTNTPVLPGDDRRGTGQGRGCSFLLEQGTWPDAAVIAKPGWTVSWEEVGLAWFDLVVRGTHTYVGSRHRLPYTSAVAAAGEVARRAELWFAGYTAAHTDGLVAPQGVLGAVEGGWTRMPAVTPASVRLRVDLRLSPRTTPAQARRELEAFVAGVRGDGIDVDCDMVLSIPGTSTDPGHWVVGRTTRAWEEIEGRPHEPVLGTSGATDANILRQQGIPTARVGMPKVPEVDGAPPDFALGMDVVDVREMERLTRLLVRVAVETCTRTLEEVAA